MAKRGRPRKAETDLVAMVAELTEERDNARRSSENRFIMSQTLAKQLVAAEDRIKELLAEIRTYEHEHMTLRQIIIDGLRRD